MTKAKLNKAIDALVKRLEKTEKFALEQAPDICKQMIEEERIEVRNEMVLQIFGLVVALIFLIVSPAVFFGADPDSGWRFASGLTFLVSLAVFFPIADGLISLITRLQLIKHTPKLFLLREFRKLLK